MFVKRAHRLLAALPVLLLVLTATAVLAQNTSSDRQHGYVHGMIEEFIENSYLQEWFAARKSVRRHFSDPVTYYWGRKNVSRRAVIRDKEVYARRWPDRRYRLDRDSLTIRPHPRRPATYYVTFDYRFDARNSRKRSCGWGESELLLKLLGDEIIILAEGGRVLDRQC